MINLPNGTDFRWNLTDDRQVGSVALPGMREYRKCLWARLQPGVLDQPALDCQPDGLVKNLILMPASRFSAVRILGTGCPPAGVHCADQRWDSVP